MDEEWNSWKSDFLKLLRKPLDFCLVGNIVKTEPIFDDKETISTDDNYFAHVHSSFIEKKFDDLLLLSNLKNSVDCLGGFSKIQTFIEFRIHHRKPYHYVSGIGIKPPKRTINVLESFLFPDDKGSSHEGLLDDWGYGRLTISNEQFP